MNITFINDPKKNPVCPFLIINKPSGLPSAPINEFDTQNALSYAIKEYPQIKNVKGKKEIEYGLIHRIDTVTNGLILIALNQEFYDYMLIEQEKGRFIKTYKAICQINNKLKEGFPPIPQDIVLKVEQSFTISSFFRNFGLNNKEVRPVTKDCSKIILSKTNTNKIYSTTIKINKITDSDVYVECKINKGYRHQVRAHLAWCGLPIKNDNVYNKKTDKIIEFKACGLEFNYKDKDYKFFIE